MKYAGIYIYILYVLLVYYCTIIPNKKCIYIYIICLVGGIPTPLKHVKVSWDDDIPKIWKHKKCSKPPTRCYILYVYIYIYISFYIIYGIQFVGNTMAILYWVQWHTGIHWAPLGSWNKDHWRRANGPVSALSCCEDMEDPSWLVEKLSRNEALLSSDVYMHVWLDSCMQLYGGFLELGLPPNHPSHKRLNDHDFVSHHWEHCPHKPPALKTFPVERP